MAKLYPLQGIRYHEKINMKEVITPPYDVINPEEQKQLYQKSPYNFIHLEYGYSLPHDSVKDNRYTRASKTFKKWLDEGILQKDCAPYFYLYQQDFSFYNKQYSRIGLVAAVALTPYSEKVILPHERTLSKPKQDRLELLRHCHANFSPIFSLFEDEHFAFETLLNNYKIKEKKPVTDFIDENNSRHRLWQITSHSCILQIQGFFDDKQLFIADGHHRYETSLAYYEEQKKRGKEGFDRTLMFLFNLFDKGILVLPTHRLIRTTKLNPFKEVLKKLEQYFSIRKYSCQNKPADYLSFFLQELQKKGNINTSFGLYPGGSDFYLCTYLQQDEELDVNLIQKHLLQECLGIGVLQLRDNKLVSYHKKPEEALQLAQDEPGSLAVFLNPPQIKKIIEKMKAGLILPQKSTYFYPKLCSGLIINSLDNI
ncbi:MAG: DUF1015 domain-containing protein [Firmicutes bacterium]|nr:DUF1015 domain-containing protein [Bacillota bacterium]